MATVASLQFLEIADEIYPVDATGNLSDLSGDDGASPVLALPAITEGGLGRARLFGTDIGLKGVSSTPGSDPTVLTRDVTLRAFLSYNVAAASDTDIGTVVSKGLEDGTSGERRLYGMEIERVSATEIKVRARWEEADGTDAVVVGASFIPPTGFFQLAVVRRWVSTTEVIVDYVVNDKLIGTETVAEGDIGNGATAALTVGCAGDPASPGDYERFLPTGSAINFLSVEDDAMSVEELRQEFLRITKHQPNGYRIIRSYQPPGQAWNRNPDSNIQRFFGALGDVLGLSIASMEKLRDDYLPDRSYGNALAAWETLFGLSPKPRDTIADRRTNVLSFMRTILGFQVDDIKVALEVAFGIDDSLIDLLEYTGERSDDFLVDDITSFPSRMWRTYQGNGAVSIAGGVCSVTAAISTQIRTETAPYRVTPLTYTEGGNPANSVLVSKIDLQLAAITDCVVGHIWHATTSQDAVIIGKRATDEIAVFEVVAGEPQSPVAIYTGVSTDPLWLRTRIVNATTVEIDYSTTSATSGFQTTPLTHTITSLTPLWAGFGLFGHTNVGLTAGQDADFDEVTIFESNSIRPLHWQAYRNPGLGGSYNLITANLQIQKQKPAHTEACAVDDVDGFELGPTGVGRLGCEPLYPAGQIIT